MKISDKHCYRKLAQPTRRRRAVLTIHWLPKDQKLHFVAVKFYITDAVNKGQREESARRDERVMKILPIADG